MCPYISQENLLQPELNCYKFYVVVYLVPNIIFLTYIPCSKLEGLTNIPWPAAHTCTVNVWEYLPPPRDLRVFREENGENGNF